MLDAVLPNLPKGYILWKLECMSCNEGRYTYRAELLQKHASMQVEFCRDGSETDLHEGDLVTVRWKTPVRSNMGAMRVTGLQQIPV